MASTHDLGTDTGEALRIRTAGRRVEMRASLSQPARMRRAPKPISMGQRLVTASSNRTRGR